MASQNLNVGTANQGDGMSLRQAFINTRKMFADMYGITYTSDTQDISGSSFAIDHGQLANRYKAKATSTATGSQDLDASAATTFLLTGNVATATLTIQNMKLGQVIDIVLSGSDLSAAVITLATNFTSATINKVGSGSLDTSKTNVIQVVCIDDTTSAAIVNYSINAFEVDTTP